MAPTPAANADLLARKPVIAGGRWLSVEIGPDDAPALQAFYDANPLYSEMLQGQPWRAEAARQELAERPPADWPQGESRFWAVLERESGRWLAYVSFVEDLLAEHVWHGAFFLVATAEHGSGLAAELYDAWESHAREHGARWLRCGVMTTNARGLAFWKRRGYVEVRQREQGGESGPPQRTSVQVKPLGDATVAEYLERVERDRPEDVTPPGPLAAR